MNDKHYNPIDPWDDGVYGIGNTMPPKTHEGTIALLLMVVIFLSGIVSALGFLNIKLFQELNAQNEQTEMVPISFSDLADATSATEGVTHPRQDAFMDISLELNGSPQSVENIPQEGGLSLQEIYTKNIPSVVSITSSTKTGVTTGTGVILSERGYLVTNYHVIQDAETITIQLSDERVLAARLVGADKVSDLAVLYVDAPDLKAAEFGDSTSLRVGDMVAAIGDPLGTQLQGSMTNGIVSAVSRSVTMNGFAMELIQTNADLNPGNSGGPLINCYGQVIGINTMVLRESGNEEVEGVGFAIPSTSVKRIVDQLLSQGYVSGRPTLGLVGDSVTRFDQSYFHIPAGLYLTQVEPGSDADAHGIVPGDILISLDGTPILSQTDLEGFVFAHQIGDSLSAVIYRGGQQFTLSLKVLEATG